MCPELAQCPYIVSVIEPVPSALQAELSNRRATLYCHVIATTIAVNTRHPVHPLTIIISKLSQLSNDLYSLSHVTKAYK